MTGDIEIEEATKTKQNAYLGYTITKDTSSEEGIKSKLPQILNGIKQLHLIIWHKNLTTSTKINICNIVV